MTLTFPTADGESTMALAFAVVFGGPPKDPTAGLARLHGRGDGFTFEGGVTPSRGDCVTSPVTRAVGRWVIDFGPTS